jgi:hypothetical protein
MHHPFDNLTMAAPSSNEFEFISWLRKYRENGTFLGQFRVNFMFAAP